MHVVENRFEIGEECYSVYRKPIQYKCPVCEGKGSFLHNGYEIDCKNCGGSGKQVNPRQYIMDVCKVRIRRIVATIWQKHTVIKYKVDCDDYSVNATNRSELNLFKTEEEAKKYCEDVNTKRVTPEF